MDYGYQLLRHVVQQVFGNLREAAQLTLTLFLVPYIALILTGVGAIGVGGAFGGAAGVGTGLLLLPVLIVVVVLAYCWMAVGWHRYVLLEEMGNGFLPNWHKGEVFGYLGRAVIVLLVVIAAVFAAAMVLGILVGVTQSTALALVLVIGMVFGVSWLATRIGLVLPAAALGNKMGIGESWALTKPVSGHILLPLIVIALVVGVITQTVFLVFGQTTTIELGGITQEQQYLTLPGQLINGVVYWFQMLINLALMTTLYGNLVEGRQLN